MSTIKETKQLKKNALMSFLEATATPNTTTEAEKSTEGKIEGQ